MKHTKHQNVLFLMMHKGFTIGEWHEKMEHVISLKCVQSWENIAHAYGLPKVLMLFKKHLNMLEKN
jgi:uncharacterized radical SAM superfamily protein